jgi:hypothetical protein
MVAKMSFSNVSAMKLVVFPFATTKQEITAKNNDGN